MEITVNAPVIGLAVTILLNFGAIIWAVARFRSELTHLSTALGRLSDVLDHLDERVDQHETRLSVLEDRRQHP